MDKTCCRVSGRDNAIDDDDDSTKDDKSDEDDDVTDGGATDDHNVDLHHYQLYHVFLFYHNIILLRRNYKYETSIRQLQQCLRSGRLHGWIDKMQRLANTLSTRKMISSCSLLLVIVNKEIMEIIRRCNEMTNA